MQLITTTELRHKSSKLIRLLGQGQSLTLIHRSKVVGKINPISPEPSDVSVQDLEDYLLSISPKQSISESNRKKLYQKHLKESYG